MSHHFSGPDFAFPHGDARLNFTGLYVFPKSGDDSKSILILDSHPSLGVNPPGPTTTDLFSPKALYEIMIDTDGDHVVNIAYSVRWVARFGEPQTHLQIGHTMSVKITVIYDNPTEVDGWIERISRYWERG
jgi:hypothetical protein